MPKKIHTQRREGGFPVTITKRILCDVAESEAVTAGKVAVFTDEKGLLTASDSITVTSIHIDATPTPVVPVAGVTLIFKGGVCTGVNP